MRQLILVELFWTRDKDPRVPLAMGSLLAATRQAGIDARGLNVPVNDPDSDIDDILVDIDASIDDPERCDVGFGVYVWNEEYIQQIGNSLRRRYPNLRIILGGPQISYSGPGLEERYPFGDAFVRGYGESALVEILKHDGQPEIDGVHWAGDTDLGEQTRVDLDDLPSPFLSGSVDVADQQFIRWETKRGCSFRCAFCQHREAGKRLTRRELSRNRLIDEIELFCNSDIDEIAILDPIFNQGPDYMAVLEEFVHRGYDGHLSLQCRFELVDDDFLDLVTQLNCSLEFGLQSIHRDEGEAVNRPNHIQKVDEAIAGLHRREIHFEVSLIFGLPIQTLTSFEQSVKYCLKRQIPVIKAFPLMLLRGTPLEQQREQWNLVESDDPIPMVVASDSYDRADQRRMSALSEALKATEGTHPATLDELRRLANDHAPDPRRWTPERM